MAGETSTVTDYGHVDRIDWVPGAVGGLVGGAVFGLLIQFVVGAMPAIGALYGAPGPFTGWAAHLFHSAVFGLAYAVVVETDAIERHAVRPTTGAGLGVAYGVVVWAVFLALVWPVWLAAVGWPGAPAVPYLNPMALVGHVVYGAVLGAVYALLR